MKMRQNQADLVEKFGHISPQSQEHFFIQNISNYTFLGNEISSGYRAYIFPSTQYVNLSDSVNIINIAGGPFSSMICLTNYTKLNFPYSNPVVSIVNTSISISQPLFNICEWEFPFRKIGDESKRKAYSILSIMVTMPYEVDKGAHSVYSLYYHFIQVVK